MKNTNLVTVLALIAALATAPAWAMDVGEIVEKANLASYYGGDDGKARARMIIKSAGGDERTREFTILRKDGEDGGAQFYYVYFHRPGDVQKTVFMVHKKIGADDDRWLYLPALDLVKRIAASDKRTSFVGSHFFYEDVSGRQTDEDTHKLAEETDDYYVIESTPKDPGTVEFSSFKTWVDKVTFLPMKAEYLDKSKKPYRAMEVMRVEEVDGIPTVMEAKMMDLASGGETVMSFSNVEYGVGLEESLFSERYLRNPPRRHIRR